MPCCRWACEPLLLACQAGSAWLQPSQPQTAPHASPILSLNWPRSIPAAAFQPMPKRGFWSVQIVLESTYLMCKKPHACRADLKLPGSCTNNNRFSWAPLYPVRGPVKACSWFGTAARSAARTLHLQLPFRVYGLGVSTRDSGFRLGVLSWPRSLSPQPLPTHVPAASKPPSTHPAGSFRFYGLGFRVYCTASSQLDAVQMACEALGEGSNLQSSPEAAGILPQRLHVPSLGHQRWVLPCTAPLQPCSTHA